MRLVVVAAAVLGGLLFLTLGRGAALPWQPECRVVDQTGTVLVQGAPAEVAAAVDGAEGPLRRALRAGPAASCRIAAMNPTDTPKAPPRGLTPRAEALRAEVRAEFGDVPAGGFGPEEVLPGRRAGGEHSLGRAIDFFFRPYDRPARQRQGWQVANWLVVHADRLGIRTVIYRDRIWTARRSAQGWRDYRFRGADPDNPVNRHLDHVHVDVA